MRLPPALAAAATTQILELLAPPPGRILELGFAGVHAMPLRLAGYDVVVVEPEQAHRERAQSRAGEVLDTSPGGMFDAVVAPESADLSGIEVRMVLLVRHDGSVWSSASS